MSQSAKSRFPPVLPPPRDTHHDAQTKNVQSARNTSPGVASGAPRRHAQTQPRDASQRQRCGDGRRRGGSGDHGNDAGDAGGDGGNDERGCACATRAQTLFSVWRAHKGFSSRGMHVWAGMGGRTVARVVALALQEGPPSPAARPGPVHVTGRAARSRAHALSGEAATRFVPRSRCRWNLRHLCACTFW